MVLPDRRVLDGSSATRRAASGPDHRVGISVSGRRKSRFAAVAVVLAFVVSGGLAAQSVSGATTGKGSWSMYGVSLARTGFDAGDTSITTSNVTHLKKEWTASSGGASIFSQPIEADGMVYWGSFNGNEYAANPATGQQVWSTNVGKLQLPSKCDTQVPNPLGVSGTSEFVKMSISGHTVPVLFVTGGQSTVYALNATTGAILWHTALGTSAWDYIWDAPAIWDGSVFVGLASPSNCPVTEQGVVFKLNATTGAVQQSFDVVPAGCVGGGIWGSLAIDTHAGTIYVPTGSPDFANGCTGKEPNAPDLLELKASNLSLVGHWQVPKSDQISDSDFGATPTLFEANGKPMVGLVNKNGLYYAFQRDDLAAGPVWSTRVSNDKSVQPLGESAYDGSYLYVTGGTTTTGDGTACHKSLWKLDPATGAAVWSRCLVNGGLGAVSMVPGLVLVGTSYQISVFSAASGSLLYSYVDKSTGSSFWGSGSFSDGEMFFGNKNGDLYAFGLGS